MLGATRYIRTGPCQKGKKPQNQIMAINNKEINHLNAKDRDVTRKLCNRKQQNEGMRKSKAG